MKKRVLSLLLVLVMLLSLLPTAALADETQDQPSDQDKIVLDSEETTQEEPEQEVDEVPAPEEPTEEPAPQVTTDEATVFTDSTGKPVCDTHGTVDGEKALTTDADGALLIDDTKANYKQEGNSYYYILPAGTYYLAEALKPKSGIKVASGEAVTLCLNGKNIQLNRDRYSSADINYNVITLEYGASLTLTDCQGVAGSITQTSTSSGRGVEVKYGSTFTMYAGNITGNHLGGRGWTGIGVSVMGTFTMYGGSITDNKNNDSSVGGSFIVSGNVEIKNNTDTASGSETTVDNVYLEKSDYYGQAVLTIGEGGLGNNAYIGLGAAGLDTPGAYAIAVQPAAGYTLTQNDFDRIYCDDTNYTKQLKDNTILLANGSPHFDHGICGDSTCGDAGHVLPSGETWKPISDLSTITEAGYYYLTQDVERTASWVPNVNVTLCLNGHSITMSDDSNAVIRVNENYIFTLCDCNSTASEHHFTNDATDGPFKGRWKLDDSGEITVDGGIITNTTTSAGVGVSVFGGTFNMYGGALCGNYGNPGSVHVNSGTFNMYGGAIRGNRASAGGGVNVSKGATFNMRGGIITENAVGGPLPQGGGVCVSGTFTVSGNVKITGNKDANDATNNVYLLASGATIQIVGELDPEARIGVTSTKTLSTTPVTVATLAEGVTYTPGSIFSDLGDPSGVLLEDGKVNLYSAIPHKHPICGSTCEDGTNHGEQTWEPVSSLSEITGAGNYYLTDDVTLSSAWTSGYDVNLCLNGHSITLQSSTSDRAIRVNNDSGSNKTLSISDCNGSGKGNGIITGASAYGVYVPSTNAFNLYGGTITGNGTGVQASGNFNMYGGVIKENSWNGVYSSPNFHMYGGSIINNTSQGNNGSGVYAYRGMTVSGDVTITGNKNKNGDENNVYLPDGKTITVSGALGENAKIGVTTEKAVDDGNYVTVAKGKSSSPEYTLTEADLKHFESDNTAYTKRLNGNSVIFYKGTLHEHAVCGKTGCTDGHDTAIYTPLTSTDGKLYRSGVEVTSATSVGVLYYQLPVGNYYLADSIAIDKPIMINGDVNLCLNGHTITTTATLTASGQALIKNDGHSLTICDCSESGSGTIDVPSTTNGILTTGALTMYGGKITGATTGVYLHTLNGSTGTFQMYGGTITGNHTGVSRYDNANTLTFGGDAKVKDNTNINVSLLNTGTITIDASLTKDAEIGVYFTQEPADKTTKQFATGATGDLDYAKIFSCDNGADYVLTKDDSGNLYFGKHQHVWKYEVSGATITATCTAKGCDLTDCIGGSVTIKAPTGDLTYDGNAKAATLENKLNSSIDAPTISYSVKDGNALSGAPKDAGTYTASITLGEGENAVPASVTYAIEKATPTVNDFNFAAPNDLTYNGDPKTASVTANSDITGMGDVTVKYYPGGTAEAPTNAGTYTVKITVADGTNYTQADLEDTNWKFTISKNTTTPTVDLSQNYSLTYNKTQLKPPVTVTVGGKTLTENVDYTVSYGENTNVSSNDNYVAIEPMGNYGFNKYTRYFSITPRYIEVKADDRSSRVGQPLAALTYTCVTEGLPYEGDTFSGELATDANKDAAGSYNITQGDLTLGNNYNIDFKPGAYIVNAKDAQKAFKFANTEVTKTYGTDKEFTIAATGAESGSEVTYTSNTPAVATVDETTGKVTIHAAGKATITAKASETANYLEGTASYELTVAKKTLTADDLEFTTNIITKTYDGNTSTEAKVQIKNSAKVNQGDELPAVNGTYAYNSPNVKDAKTVAFTSEASNNDNYILPAGLTVEHDASITKARLHTFGYSAANATYGTKLGDIDIQVTVVIDDTETVVNGRWAWASANDLTAILDADTDAVFEAVFTPAKGADNYELLTAGISPTITKAAQTILLQAAYLQSKNGVGYDISKYAGAKGVEGGTAPGALSYELVGTYEGVTLVDNVLTVQPNATAASITIKVTAAATNNYEKAESEFTVTLSDRPLNDNFKFKEASQAKTYGDGKFTAKANGNTIGSRVSYSSDNEKVATVDPTTGEVTIVGVGTAIITATASATSTYAETTASYTLTVDKATITITAKDQSAYVGDKAPTLGEDSYTISGLVNGEALKAKPTVAYASTPDMTKAGEVAIKVSGAVAPDGDNYTIEYVDGKLTIANRPSSGVPTYPVNTPSAADNGSVSASTKNAASGSTVTITVKPDEGYQLSGLTVTDSKGNALPLTDLGNGKFSFTMPSGKVEVNATFAKEVEVSPFKDVAASAYYYDAVKWAVENGITDGIGNGLFAPNTSCTRAQIVTFLWRAAGSPEPKSMNSFKDVAADAYYAKAVAWAVENGITTGTVTDKFSPNESCTRAQSVAFLFRAAKASATGAPAFSDVAANAYYAEAVKWAVDNGVTDGVGNGKFAPNDACTRAQIVTFLWRLHAGK